MPLPRCCHAVIIPSEAPCPAGLRGRRLVLHRLPPPTPPIQAPPPVAMGGFCPCLPSPTAPVTPSAPQPEEDSTVTEEHQALGAVPEPHTGPPLQAPPPRLPAVAVRPWERVGAVKAPPPGAEFGICRQGSPQGFKAPPAFKAPPKAPPPEWRSPGWRSLPLAYKAPPQGL